MTFDQAFPDRAALPFEARHWNPSPLFATGHGRLYRLACKRSAEAFDSRHREAAAFYRDVAMRHFRLAGFTA